ncbi:Arc/MetJ-type ribon-helix-helix transcriptional regulator [Rhizobium sp. SG_E_25_P2]|uniref:hypothetical protein n=1 Tax=Rhizobium sp. SG_E_25_P2 TaxID=2879942 RepID=UPI002474A68D|nr:hypothetical protein [Rhizobium sp. SG_E_25_P2]MDH6267126.1 Arc/MetJ-type ribon-helix-helix transcriptional regulator [Rhizobium sp. SG_E_25_P2]
MSGRDRIRVELNDEHSAALRALVEAGTYPSVEAIIGQALETWQASRLVHGYTPEEIGRLWDEGQASGDLIDGDEAFRQIREEFQAGLRKAV